MHRNQQLTKIVLNGYKSIKHCELALSNINVLIGPNGAGKSNFISFFKLIQKIRTKQLQYHVGKSGGPDIFLHFGRKETSVMAAEIYFGDNGYKFELEPTDNNQLMFSKENMYWAPMKRDFTINSNSHLETLLEEQTEITKIAGFIIEAMDSWRVYHFHDTSNTAEVKRIHGINDNMHLKENASNLAAFLYRLKNHHQPHYKRIVKTIQLSAPFFGDFNLNPTVDNKDYIELEWFEKGKDTPFKAQALSDGTLRLICLTTLLLQPDEFKPETILIDEPELGLHPYAIKQLASLIQMTAETKQVIISTQSIELLNEFQPKDIIVADRKDGIVDLHRLNENDLTNWLEDYSIGELWLKNLLGGRPA